MYVCMYVCTAHLQRDAKHLTRKSNDKQTKILYGKLSKLLHRARIWSIQKHDENQRRTYKENLLTTHPKTDHFVNIS